MANESKVLTGCRARFQLQGKKVGYATDVSVRQAINYEAVNTLDDIAVTEHVPVGYDVSLTAGRVRLIGDTIKSNGWFPSQGKTSAEFLTNILNTGELTATIEDSITGKIVAHVEAVKLSESNVQITARGVVGENVSFVAKRVRDEFDLI